MAVAGDHLGGRHRLEAERPAHVRLDLGLDVRVGPDRPRELADRDPAPGRDQPLAVAVDLQRPQGELGPEGGRLGVHPVGAPGHRRPSASSPGPGDQGRDQPVGRLDQQVGGLDQRDAAAAVSTTSEDVSPKWIQAPSGRADPLLDDIDERRQVVVGGPLPLGHRVDELPVDLGRAVAHRRAPPRGATPAAASASTVSSSTSSQRPSRASSLNSDAMSAGA